MKAIKPGDKVKFINEVGGGIVLSINGKTAIIESEDGFEIPVLLSSLIKTEKFWIPSASTENENSPHVPAPSNKPVVQPRMGSYHPMDEVIEETEGIEEHRPMIPDPDSAKVCLSWTMHPTSHREGSEYSLWLVNDSTYRVLFSVYFSDSHGLSCRGIKGGLLEEETKILLGKYSESTLKSYQNLGAELIFYAQNQYEAKKPLSYFKPIDSSISFDPKAYHINDYFSENAIIEEITEEIKSMSDLLKPEYLSAKSAKTKTTSDIRNKPPEEMEEIDLHIESILENFASLSPGEILEAQMSRFHIALQGAIQHGVKKIVFIHGVGNGKLRYEIRKTLEQQYRRLRYQDASFKEYGYGATMILLK